MTVKSHKRLFKNKCVCGCFFWAGSLTGPDCLLEKNEKTKANKSVRLINYSENHKSPFKTPTKIYHKNPSCSYSSDCVLD